MITADSSLVTADSASVTADGFATPGMAVRNVVPFAGVNTGSYTVGAGTATLVAVYANEHGSFTVPASVTWTRTGSPAQTFHLSVQRSDTTATPRQRLAIFYLDSPTAGAGTWSLDNGASGNANVGLTLCELTGVPAGGPILTATGEAATDTVTLALNPASNATLLLSTANNGNSSTLTALDGQTLWTSTEIGATLQHGVAAKNLTAAGPTSVRWTSTNPLRLIGAAALWGTTTVTGTAAPGTGAVTSTATGLHDPGTILGSAVQALTPVTSTATGTHATTIYYVASNGSSTNPGTQAQPFGSPLHLPTLQPGDTVLFRRGDLFNVASTSGWTVSAAGQPFKWVNFGAYGTGVKPRIRCADASPDAASNRMSLRLSGAAWCTFEDLDFIEAGKHNLLVTGTTNNIRFRRCDFQRAVRCGMVGESSAYGIAFTDCRFLANGSIANSTLETSQDWHGLCPRGGSGFITLIRGEHRENYEDGIQTNSTFGGMVVQAYGTLIAKNGLADLHGISQTTFQENEIDLKNGDNLYVDCTVDHYDGEGGETIVVHQSMGDRRTTILGGQWRGKRTGTVGGDKKDIDVGAGEIDILGTHLISYARAPFHMDTSSGVRARLVNVLAEVRASGNPSAEAGAIDFQFGSGHLAQNLTVVSNPLQKAVYRIGGSTRIRACLADAPNRDGVTGTATLTHSGNHWRTATQPGGDTGSTTGAITYAGDATHPYLPATSWSQTGTRSVPRYVLNDIRGHRRAAQTTPGCYDPQGTPGGLDWAWPMEFPATPQIDYCVPSGTTTLLMLYGGLDSPSTTGMSLLGPGGERSFTLLEGMSSGTVGLHVGVLHHPPTGDVELRPGCPSSTLRQGVRVIAIKGGAGVNPVIRTSAFAGTAPSQTVTAADARSLVIDALATNATAVPSPTGTEQFDVTRGWVSGGRLIWSFTGSPNTTNGSTTMGWDTTGTNQVHAVLVFAPASEAPEAAVGSANQTVGAVTSQASGNFNQNVVLGGAQQAVGAVTAQASGTYGRGGTASSTVGPVLSQAEGSQTVTGAGSATVGPVGSSAGGVAHSGPITHPERTTKASAEPRSQQAARD